MAKKSAPTASAAPSALHPGQHVRDIALTPKKLTVTDAAKLLGVSRPSMNFLNGKVSATSDMAARVERALGFRLKTCWTCRPPMTPCSQKAKGAVQHQGLRPAFPLLQGKRHRGVGKSERFSPRAPQRVAPHAGPVDRRRSA